MKYLFVSLILCFSTYAHAQHDSVGKGGKEREQIMKGMIGDLDAYFSTEAALHKFPIVKKWNTEHPDLAFHVIASQLNPTLADPGKAVKDDLGKDRDCVSYDKPTRYFVCRDDFVPDHMPLDQQRRFYAFLLHEIFVQMGVEVPVSKEVTSEYPYSSLLTFSLETIQRWVPGENTLPESLKLSCDIVFTDLISGQSSNVSATEKNNIFEFSTSANEMLPVLETGNFRIDVNTFGMAKVKTLSLTLRKKHPGMTSDPRPEQVTYAQATLRSGEAIQAYLSVQGFVFYWANCQVLNK